MLVLYYWRRVPKALEEIDFRAPIVRHSLRTEDLAKARAQRDVLEKADKEPLWAAMLLEGKGSPQATESAKLLSEALGFSNRPPMNSRVQLLKRSSGAHHGKGHAGRRLHNGHGHPASAEGECPATKSSQMKSLVKAKPTEKVKRRAINSFIAVVEDKAMVDITRNEVRVFHRHWLDKFAPRWSAQIRVYG